MVDVFKEKEALTSELSDQYAKSLISLDEFENMVDQVNKVDSLKQLDAVKKTICENTSLVTNSLGTNSLAANSPPPGNLPAGKVKKRNYETVFSSRSITAESINGHAGNFSCVFGANKIKVKDLPAGKTVLKLEAVFASTEIFVPKNVKIVNNVTAVFAGVFMPSNEDPFSEPASLRELHIKGDAVFANVTIKRTE